MRCFGGAMHKHRVRNCDRRHSVINFRPLVNRWLPATATRKRELHRKRHDRANFWFPAYVFTLSPASRGDRPRTAIPVGRGIT